MFRIIPTTVRAATRLHATPRAFCTVSTMFTAGDAAELSGYNKINFCIDEDATVLEAVQSFVAYNIGCLVTKNSNGTIVVENLPFIALPMSFYSNPMYILFYKNRAGDLTGIISERDYISKVDLLDRSPETTTVKEIFTPSSKLVTANGGESVQVCIEKMLAADVRHLPLVDHGELIGMISIKDLVRTCIKEQDQTMKVLSDLTLGKSTYSC